MSTLEGKKSRRLQDIGLIVRDLLKVIKVVSMYPEDNPLPQSLRRTFSERLVDLVTEYGGLEFRIDHENLYYDDEIVFTDRSKEESLAGMFFDTGIIRIKFKANLEVDDIYRLLEAIKTFQNTDRRTSDLAAILWETGIPHFYFETIEDVSLRQLDGDILVQGMTDTNQGGGYQQIASDAPEDYGDIFNLTEDASDSADDKFGDDQSVLETSYLPADDGVGDSPLSTGNDTLDSALMVNEATAAMGFGEQPAPPRPEVDTNLILNDELKLSSEEIEQVDLLVRRDAEFVEYESVCELLKEILHQEAEMSDFYETVTICEKVLMEFVSAGGLTYAADLLRYFVSLENQLRTDRALWSERLKEARVTAGSRDRLSILCESLNANVDIGSVELRRYLDNFNWEALMGITDMLGDLRNDLHRDAVQDYLTSRGKDHIHIVAKGIQDKRPEVVAASVTILARIGAEKALQQLERVTDHEEVTVRRALASAMADCPNDDCLRLLKQMVSDKDVTVRRSAVDAIVARRGQAAFDTLSEILNDDRFFSLEQDDQRSVLIAYSTLGGDMAVDYLVRLGEKSNLFGKSSLAFYREASFEALAHNRGERAERMLIKLSGNWRADIKSHAKAALQQRRELIYGDSDDQPE